MEKEFLNWEQSKALVELGFEEDCFGWYFGDSSTNPIHIEWIRKGVGVPYIPAPLYQQAFRFFRDVYGLDSFRRKIGDVAGSYWSIKKIDTEDAIKGYSNFKATYEEAELDCLNTLIELVKTKVNATDRK